MNLTLDDDLRQAREILTKPKREDVDRFVVTCEKLQRIKGAEIGAGFIHHTDIYTAHTLLERFVAEITRLRETQVNE